MDIHNTYNTEELKLYIGESRSKVPYLYSNLFHYSPDNNDIKIWIAKDEDTISGIFLMYHTCLHFFTNEDNFDNNLFNDFVEEYQPHLIMLSESNVNSLTFKFKSVLNRENIFIHEKENPTDTIFDCVNSENEILEVEQLLMKSEVFNKIYSYGELYEQLKERLNNGYGKIFVARCDDKIVACSAVTGENDKFIFYGCLGTNPYYSRRGYAKNVLNQVFQYANKLNKDCLFFVNPNNINSILLHKKNFDVIHIGDIYKYTIVKK